MPTVETTITVGIPEGGASLGEVEKRAAEAVQEAGRELLPAACRAPGRYTTIINTMR